MQSPRIDTTIKIIELFMVWILTLLVCFLVTAGVYSFIYRLIME